MNLGYPASEGKTMPRIPKGDAPTLAYYFLAMLILIVTLFGVAVGIKGLGELIHRMLWVLV